MRSFGKCCDSQGVFSARGHSSVHILGPFGIAFSWFVSKWRVFRSIGTLSIQRNPVLYRFLRDMHDVEGLGIGIPRMRSLMCAQGFPDPELFFKVILRKIAVKQSLRSDFSLNLWRMFGIGCS